MTTSQASAFVPELARCAADRWYWLTTYVYVSNPDPAKGTIKFEPWMHLHQLNGLIEDHNRIVVLKARQIGISWLLAAIALHYVLFTPNANVIIFSKRQTESIAMKERANFIWRYLPPWMQQPVGKDNDELLTFPTMESKIQSFPATPGAGRSETATLAIMDEWAYVEYAREIYTGVLPTVEHTKLIGVSTAQGTGGKLPDGSLGNLFADTYWKAKRGHNQFIPVFIPYDVVPGRNEDWWERQKLDMPAYLALQEYPKREADAFLVAGTCMFDIAKLRAMPVISVSDTPDLSTTPEIYVPYDASHTYSAGVDTALGVAGGDFNILQIVDETTGDQAAKFRSRIPVDEFNVIALQLLTLYGKPSIIIEEQPQGRLLVKYLRDEHYPEYRIYKRSKNVPCWHSNEPNRKNVLQELETAIRTGLVKIHSQNTVDESLAFGYNAKEGKFEALSGHDDEVMSLALAWHQKINLPPALDEDQFQPKSYLSGGGGEYVDWDDIPWQQADPFKHLLTVPCPSCLGKRWVEVSPGFHNICEDCAGLGELIQRKPH